MKKIIACISLVFAMSAGVTALAEVKYDNVENSVTPIGDGYTTVLIEKNATEDGAPKETVFVDQNDSCFESTTQFLLKNTELADGTYGLADGTYTVKMGGHATAAPISDTFTISSDEKITVNAEIMGREFAADGTYSIGCKATADLKNAAYLVITATKTTPADGEGGEATTITKTAYFPTNWSGTGEVNLGVKITKIPDYITDITVGLSNVNK